MNQPWKQRLADVVKLDRDITGDGLREYARRVGMSVATICRIEQGKGCDVDNLLTLHRARGISVHTMLGIGKAKP